MQQDKEFLGKAPVGRLLLKLALPTVVAQLVNMLYNVVDRIYIGHIEGYGDLALTGVGVYFVSGLFFFWFGLGIFFSSYFIWGLFMKYAGVTVPKKKKKKNSIDPYL